MITTILIILAVYIGIVFIGVLIQRDYERIKKYGAKESDPIAEYIVLSILPLYIILALIFE